MENSEDKGFNRALEDVHGMVGGGASELEETSEQ